MDGEDERLQEVIDEQANLNRAQIGEDEYNALKEAYDAFMAKLTDIVDGIRNVSEDSNSTSYTIYDLQGRMIAKPQKGINIIHFKDGTKKKVLVK